VGHSLTSVIDAFHSLDVLVIGEAMLDTYLEGSAGRICREAPVPIVDVDGCRVEPGGAANAAVNAAALGAKVRFLSAVGDDDEGATLRRALGGRRIDPEDVFVDASRRTLSKTRLMAAAQLLVRFDKGSRGPVGPETERALVRRLIELFPQSDAVVISDYGYGILTPRTIAALAGLQARWPRVLVADSKDLTAYRRVGATAAKPNYVEAMQLACGRAGEGPAARCRADEVVGRADSLLERTGARIAAVTLDTDGAVILERGRAPYRTYARPSPHSRAAGAGDTFLATLGMALAAGAETHAAADLASAACSIVVSRDGTAACSARDLRDRLAGESKPAADRDELGRRLEDHRRAGRRIVFTNGCFDILHRGHISYLSRAKALGDVLVVGVNSDAGIRRLKGPGRPINTLEDRVQMLAALNCVDLIVAFDEDTPCDLIRAFRPDLYVKGGSYTRDQLPEEACVDAYGGEVKLLSVADDQSTSAIIERVRSAYALADDGDASDVGRRVPDGLAETDGRGLGVLG